MEKSQMLGLAFFLPITTNSTNYCIKRWINITFSFLIYCRIELTVIVKTQGKNERDNLEASLTKPALA
jgi:hypothetical protein